MEHEILNGLRIKVVGDIGRKGRKRREPVDEVDLALGSRALSAYMRQQLSIGSKGKCQVFLDYP